MGEAAGWTCEGLGIDANPRLSQLRSNYDQNHLRMWMDSVRGMLGTHVEIHDDDLSCLYHQGASDAQVAMRMMSLAPGMVSSVAGSVVYSTTPADFTNPGIEQLRRHAEYKRVFGEFSMAESRSRARIQRAGHAIAMAYAHIDDVSPDDEIDYRLSDGSRIADIFEEVSEYISNTGYSSADFDLRGANGFQVVFRDTKSEAEEVPAAARVLAWIDGATAAAHEELCDAMGDLPQLVLPPEALLRRIASSLAGTVMADDKYAIGGGHQLLPQEFQDAYLWVVEDNQDDFRDAFSSMGADWFDDDQPRDYCPFPVGTPHSAAIRGAFFEAWDEAQEMRDGENDYDDEDEE